MVTIAREGTQVYQTLQKVLEDARDEAARYESDATRIDTEIDQLVAQRGEALLELARHYLPAMTRPMIEQTFEGVRADLLAILSRRDQRQKNLTEQLGRNSEDARALQSSLDEVTARLNTLVARREELEARVAEILKTNDEFQSRSRLALQAEEQLHRNEQRVAEIQAEAQEKRPGFENSRLFKYLYDRGYGTPRYRPTGLIARLDRWVANLIGYARARVGYEFLITTPALVAAEVARRRDQFNELMTQVEALQQAEAEKVGLTDVLKEGDQLGDERDRFVGQLGDNHAKREQIQNELNDIAQARDAYYEEALKRFQSFLSQTEVAVLDRRARQTPEFDDDSIVGQIAQLNRQIAQFQATQTQLAQARATSMRAAKALDDVVRRYQHSNFDSQRSYFTDDFDLEHTLALFHDGAVDANGLWQTLRACQRFRPHWVENTATTTGDILNSPSGRVIIGALGQTLNAALQQAAYRGMQRRAQMPFPMPTPNPAPMPESPPPTYHAPPPASTGGFTSGEGF